MPKRVLFVSQYTDPNLVGGNNNVYRQAKALRHSLGVNLEILTWPVNDHWSGPLPEPIGTNRFSHRNWSYEGLNYHLVNLPVKFLERRVLSDSDWEQAVEVGRELLEQIKPSVVHLQHWRGLWWMLESARQLSIPTVYTAHDWGIACQRTILVKGEGSLCDGIVNVDKCFECIWKGRNLLGKVNEALVSTVLGEQLIELLDKTPIEPFLVRSGAVRIGLRKRLKLQKNRVKRVLSNLSALIVPNSFAKSFYHQFGLSENRIHIVPWYSDLTAPQIHKTLDPYKITLGYIGRISPEKGIEKIFEALSDDLIKQPIHIVMAGAIQDSYAEQLQLKYKTNVGNHSVEWMGWVSQQNVHTFFEKVDVVIISSDCIENGPLTLMESFAFKRPVIITDMPSARDLVKDGRTGYLFAFGSSESLKKTIQKVVLNPNALLAMRDNIPNIKTSVEYAAVVKGIYETIFKNT